MTTVSDVLLTAEHSTHPTAIVVLPPAAGDSTTESDTEKPFETVGELEVEAEVSDSEEEQLADDESDDEITPPVKEQKPSNGKATFSILFHLQKPCMLLINRCRLPTFE